MPDAGMDAGMQARVAEMVEAYRAAKERLDFLDSNLWMGRPIQPGFCQRWDVEALQGYMSRYAIRGGIVSHSAGMFEDPTTTNEEVLAALADRPGLWAGLVLVPELPAGVSDWNAYLDQAVARKARLVRLFPATHRFSLDPWCSGPLLDAIARRRLILALWHMEVPWNAVRALLERYPELPILIEGRPQKILYHNRFFYPLLEQYGNFYLELHNLNMYLGIEDITARFGAEHLIFGSCLPVNDPNTSQMMVTAARIDEEHKTLIAHGNLQRLLGQVRVP
jgi:hypothetical protein